MKSVGILSTKVRTVSDFKPEIYSVITGVRDILYRHVMLCGILDLITSSYPLQVMALIGSKFMYATIFLLLLFFFSIFYRSLFPFHSLDILIPLGTFDVMQLVSVLCCCKSAFFQVSVI